jgi:hypothetical protein
VETRDIAYAVDGMEMVGRLALPDGEGARPGVLIAHAGNGLDDFRNSGPIGTPSGSGTSRSRSTTTAAGSPCRNAPRSTSG